MAKGTDFTDDGFKIVSSIPDDDSDVSDAFESCSEDDEEEEEEVVDDKNKTTHKPLKPKTNTSTKPKATDDGFKIVTEIPPDDSDVSDAFEGDDGEGDVKVPPSFHHQHKSVKKPILQIMSDFGIDGRALTGRKDNTPKQAPVKLSKKQKKLKKMQVNTETQAAKTKKQVNVEVFDYAKKRGVNKDKKKPKEEEEEEVMDQSLEVSKQEPLDEKQLKRVRYDVFRLGMSGFHKEKKEDTRVSIAIKLGAKPPRKKAVNYKKFQEMKKDEKRIEAEERAMKMKLGVKVPKPFKKKDRPVVKAAASQVGKYRHGVQVISKREISKISKSR